MPNNATGSSTVKSNKRQKVEDFENELLKKIDNCKTDSADRFGEEVADGIRAIKDDFSRELLKRQILDMIFKTRFGQQAAMATNTQYSHQQYFVDSPQPTPLAPQFAVPDEKIYHEL